MSGLHGFMLRGYMPGKKSPELLHQSLRLGTGWQHHQEFPAHADPIHLDDPEIRAGACVFCYRPPRDEADSQSPSTADLIASVESSSIAIASDAGLRPCDSSAISTT